MSGPASKEVEEFVKTRVVQEIISKMDPELIARLLQEVMTEEVNKIIGSYDLRKIASENVEKMVKEKVLEMARELVNQPEILGKIRQAVDDGVNGMIEKIDETVKEKFKQVLKYY